MTIALSDHMPSAAPPRQSTSPVPLIAGGWVVCNIIAGSVPLAEGLYLSQIALVVLYGVALLNIGPDQTAGRMLGLAAALALLALWSILSQGLANERFVPEVIKAALLLAAPFILWGQIRWSHVRTVGTIAPPLVLAVLLAVMLLGLGDYYGGEGRFGVPWWGSPNTTAFVIVMTMGFALYDLRERWTRQHNSFGRILRFSPLLLQLAALGGFVVFTGSSGGMMTLAVLLLRYIGVRLWIILSAIAVLIVGVIVLGVQLPELIGSGRLVIWQMLLGDFFSYGPGTWVFGRGAGAIDITPWFTARVFSAHSMYLEILYNYGVLALLGLIYALVRYNKILIKAALRKEQRVFVESMFGAVVTGFLVDTYMMTAQLSWLGAMIIGCAGLAFGRRRL